MISDQDFQQIVGAIPEGDYPDLIQELGAAQPRILKRWALGLNLPHTSFRVKIVVKIMEWMADRDRRDWYASRQREGLSE